MAQSFFFSDEFDTHAAKDGLTKQGFEATMTSACKIHDAEIIDPDKDINTLGFCMVPGAVVFSDREFRALIMGNDAAEYRAFERQIEPQYQKLYNGRTKHEQKHAVTPAAPTLEPKGPVSTTTA